MSADYNKRKEKQMKADLIEEMEYKNDLRDLENYETFSSFQEISDVYGQNKTEHLKRIYNNILDSQRESRSVDATHFLNYCWELASTVEAFKLAEEKAATDPSKIEQCKLFFPDDYAVWTKNHEIPLNLISLSEILSKYLTHEELQTAYSL